LYCFPRLVISENARIIGPQVYLDTQVLLIIILNRLRNKSEMELRNEQAGFRSGRGTRDLLVNIQILIEKVNATQNSVLFLRFVNYTKAFDMVSHLKLFKVLLEMGIPKHLVALV